MDAKALETRLLENPKYGSTWIELAVKILTGSNMLSEAKLAEFDAEQLDIINAAIEYNKKNEDKPIDITVLCDSKLNATQMKLIFAGQQNGIPDEALKTIVNAETPYATSNYVLQALIDGYDMIKYLKGYDHDQVYEIYAGLHNKIDVSSYDDPSIDATTMGIIRHGLEVGKKVEYDAEAGKITVTV